jgi:hypothetical protein
VELVTEMMDSDPTMSYPEAMERVQILREFETWEPENAYVH